MRAVMWVGPGQHELQNVPTPVVGRGDVLVDLAFAGVCGTDRAIVALDPSDRPHRLYGSGSRVLGHEMGGTVAAVGTEVVDVVVGDVVAVNPLVVCGACVACGRGQQNLCVDRSFRGIHGGGGAFAEQICVPVDRLAQLQSGSDVRLAALVEPLATAVHCLRVHPVVATDSVAVLGAGAMGQMLLAVLRAQGVQNVAVVESDPHRRSLALSHGALSAFTPEAWRVQTSPQVDVLFDAAGNVELLNSSIASRLRRGGRAVLVAHAGLAQPVDLDLLVDDEKLVGGVIAYSDGDFAAAAGLVDERLLEWVAPPMSMDEVVCGGVYSQPPAGTVKVLVRTGAAR